MNPLTEGTRITLGYDYFATGFTGSQLSEAYYRLIADKRQEALLFETATIDEVDEVYNEGEPYYEENDRLTTDLVLEAITIQKFARTDQKMAALVRVFNGYLKDKNIEAQAPIVGTPKKSGLFATVTVQIPFSDGQVVTIIFHSPDNNKMKITAEDEIIAFRWLLNKRDITHVVSPENDAEVSLQEIGKRTAQLVEKNSAKFQQQQTDLKQQKAKLEELKGQADAAAKQHDGLMATLKGGQDAIETAETKIANLNDRIAKQKAFNDDLQGKIDALRAKQAGNDGKAVGEDTTKLDQDIDAAKRTLEQQMQMPEQQELERKREAYESELTARGFVKETESVGQSTGYLHAETEINFIIRLNAMKKLYEFDVTGRPFLPSNGKAWKTTKIDEIDAKWAQGIDTVDKKMAEMKASQEKADKDAKDEAENLEQKKQEGQQQTEEVKEEPAVIEMMADVPAGWTANRFDNAVEYTDDSGEFVARVTRFGTATGDTPFRVTLAEGERRLAYFKDVATIDEANTEALYAMQNKDSLKSAYDEATKEDADVPKNGPATLVGPDMTQADEERVLSDLSKLSRDEIEKNHTAIKAYMESPDFERQDEDYQKSLRNTEFLWFTAKGNAVGRENQIPESEPPAVSVLNDILAGKYDDDLTKLGDALDNAAVDLEREGKAEEYDALLNQTADYLTERLKKEAA